MFCVSLSTVCRFAIAAPPEWDTSRPAPEAARASTAAEPGDEARPGADTETGSQSLGLTFVKPYQPGKVPVVLVHGFWGSPRNWDAMVNALETDPVVGAQFQFLTFEYTTSATIPHSASLLRRALWNLRDRLDPEGLDPAWDRMVLIGHSMGGLLCKLMTQESGRTIWDLMTARPFHESAGARDGRGRPRSDLVFQPMPEVRRLIFIATPHRGIGRDLEPIRAVATWFVRPRTPPRGISRSLPLSTGPDASRRGAGATPAASIEELAWEHPLLLAINGLRYNPDVKRHSIIAQRQENARPGGGDGLVPYASAHHPGANSERLVSAGHFCLDHPEVIGEVARILKEHASP
jgi:pimeloyl-ACP methyl ester carboxylesterase